MNRYLSDPIYHADSFWDLNCSYIEDAYTALQKVERDRLQGESITTAYLTDTVLSIAHSLYGKDGDKYKSQPQVFLPGYQPDKEADEECFDLKDGTIEIFMKERDLDRIPQFALIHLIELMPTWSEKLENR
jgi:hypothetical protein